MTKEVTSRGRLRHVRELLISRTDIRVSSFQHNQNTQPHATKAQIKLSLHLLKVLVISKTNFFCNFTVAKIVSGIKTQVSGQGKEYRM